MLRKIFVTDFADFMVDTKTLEYQGIMESKGNADRNNKKFSRQIIIILQIPDIKAVNNNGSLWNLTSKK
jgi:hypothetical protein